MPHFGSLKSILGTMRLDGPVSRVQNSLTTTGGSSDLLARIDETNVERQTEDGQARSTES